MTDANAQHEPTMEEILASIRRIISEDEQPEGAPANGTEAAPEAESELAVPPAEVVEASEEAEPEPEPEPEPVVGEPDDADVLELTEVVNDDEVTEIDAEPVADSAETDDEAESEIDLAPSEAAPSIDVATEEIDIRQPVAAEAGIVSEGAATVAASSLAGLVSAVSDTRGVHIGNGNRTLEDLIKELLRPMLKEWLDANLPALVARLVEKEIHKIAGKADHD